MHAGGAHRAGGRLDHHRVLVAEIVGDVDELQAMGDEALAPAAAGLAAEPGLQAGLDVPEGDALAAVDVAGGARWAHRVDAADRAVQDGDDGDPPAADLGLDVGHDLVAEREREADDRVEVRPRLPVDRRQVRAADAGETWPQPNPVRPGQRRRVLAHQLDRPGLRGRRRRHRREHPRQPEPPELAVDLQRSHRPASPTRAGIRATNASHPRPRRGVEVTGVIGRSR
ncbi:MAG: hypothetical protein QM733_22240 [Ilumatobacteraceae bacterium]